jgi:hypothetical protein
MIMGWLCFLTLAVLAIVLVAVDALGSSAKYLYHTEDSHAASAYPVKEYLLPENEPLSDFGYLHPEFLYKPDSSSQFSPPARVVE